MNEGSAINAITSFAEWSGIYELMINPWVWPVFESIHFVGLSLLIGTVGLFDLRVMGLCPEIELRSLHRLVPFGVLGYLLNVTTGAMFFCTFPDQYLYNPAFQVKLAFMAVAGLNVLVFYTTTFAEIKTITIGKVASIRARTIAFVSLICWIGVITGGRLITFYRPPYSWCFWCGW